MNLSIIPFDQIDKNKWNGLVHYAPNGNVYGYYWYLKAVVQEFDIIIESDYQSGMPVFKQPLTEFQKKLLPQLGIYTMNVASKSRIENFYNFWKANYSDSYYAFNISQNTLFYGLNPDLIKGHVYTLDLSPGYEDLRKTFKQETIELIQSASNEHLVTGSNPKPEILLQNENINPADLNILYRIIYNAMHRGIGFATVLEDTIQKKSVFSYFINNQKNITEIYSSAYDNTNMKIILYDYILRSNAGRPTSLTLSKFTNKDFSGLGFKSIEILHFAPKIDSLFVRFKNLF